MTTYGVTSQGFVPKPTAVILSEIEADELAKVDPELDTAPEEPVGQFNGIMANRFGELWAMLQTLANAMNPDAAEGFLLDNVSAITGCLRLPVKPSYVFALCALQAAHSPYLAGTLVAHVNGHPETKFQNALDVVITVDGISSQLFISQEDGPIEAPALTLNVIDTPVTGWTGINNTLDATLGHLEEDDPNLRIRREQELAAAGSGTDDSIRSDLMQVPGVKAVRVIDPGPVPDPVTNTPAHSFQCVVFDGITPAAQDAQIGQVIWDDKPTGINPVGTTRVDVVDSQGTPQTVFFTRPTAKPVYLAYTVTFATGLSTPDQTAAILALKQAAVNLSQGFDRLDVALPENTPGILNPGSELFALVYRSLGLQINGIVDVPQLALDFTAFPTALVNLTCPPIQILTLDTSRITVNGV